MAGLSSSQSTKMRLSRSALTLSAFSPSELRSQGGACRYMDSGGVVGVEAGRSRHQMDHAVVIVPQIAQEMR